MAAQHGLSEAVLGGVLGASGRGVAGLGLGEHTATRSSLARIDRDTSVDFIADVDRKYGMHFREVA